ncbi:hypothetical protein BKA93DRAFT_812243 [Sparassis latifolia]
MSIIPAEGSSEWLKSLIIQKCGVPSVHDFQLHHGLDLIHGKDTFLIIVPGQGKMTAMHAPLLAAQAQKKIGIALMIIATGRLRYLRKTKGSAEYLRAHLYRSEYFTITLDVVSRWNCHHENFLQHAKLVHR